MAEESLCKCSPTVDACSILEETCQSGECKCGNHESCEGKPTGEHCDATHDTCMCSPTVHSCTGAISQCSNGTCVIGDTVPCSIASETRLGGKCMCGSHESCEGRLDGSYCDATNDVCKCSPSVDACSGETSQCSDGTCVIPDTVPCSVDNEIRIKGKCMCGGRESCEGETTGSYCDADRSLCKCKAHVDSCSETSDTCTTLGCTCNGKDPCVIPGETCQQGVCKCGDHETCQGKLAGTYCDPSNHECKCSPWVDSCSGSTPQCYYGNCVIADNVSCDVTNETRTGGKCMCGARETCKGTKSGSYCDPINSICKCTEVIDSCSGTTDQCLATLEICTCGGDSPCNINGEICESGKCMCGNIESCLGLQTGSYCDASQSMCKCSSTLDACTGTTDRCINEKCTCGGEENVVCSGTSDKCINGQCMCGYEKSCGGVSDRCTNSRCKCGEGNPCSNPGEHCHSGKCMCGTELSCEGKLTGSYCDAQSSTCKCAPNVDSCPDGVECGEGKCIDEGKTVLCSDKLTKNFI